MITIEKTEVLGWEHAIRGMRNPMNSWGKSDSGYGRFEHYCDKDCQLSYCIDPDDRNYIIGPNDLDLMMRLRNAGTDHRKFMRMITVYVDITAPMYWFKQFDTYKIGTVANSCSTMHKIAAKEFTLEDFSCEHMDDVTLDTLNYVITQLEYDRLHYLKTKDKKYWWQMIQLLPSSYNQKRTVMMNYEVLTNIYKSRRNHKLDEWHTFCDWIEGLPYSELITGVTEPDESIAQELDKLGKAVQEGFVAGMESISRKEK